MRANETKEILKIVDQKFMQHVQDFFASSMEISLQSFYKHTPLTEPSNFTGLCESFIQKSKEGCKRCHEDLYNWAEKASNIKKPIIFKCNANLDNFAIPIIIEGEQLATIFGGKVLTCEPDEKIFRKYAREIGVEEHSFVKKVKEIKIIPEEKFNAIVKSLFLICNSIAQIAYAKYHLAALGMDYKMPRNIALEEWLFLNLEEIKSPLTEREFSVLKLVVAGKNNAEIAKELFISPHTAKAHVSTILEKFAVQDRVQVAVKAVKEGFV